MVGENNYHNNELEILEYELEKANERLSQQKKTLREFSQEGMNIFRLILLFVAGPAAILGALSPETLTEVTGVIFSNECTVRVPGWGCVSFQYYTIATGASIALSAIANIAGAGYEARATYAFTNPTDIIEATQQDISKYKYKKKRLEDTVERIEHNNRIIRMMEEFLAIGKAFLSFSTFLVLSLVYLGITGSEISLLVWLVALLIYYSPLLAYIRYFPDSAYRADRVINQDPLYDRDRVEKYIEKNEQEENRNRSSSEDAQEDDDENEQTQSSNTDE